MGQLAQTLCVTRRGFVASEASVELHSSAASLSQSFGASCLSSVFLLAATERTSRFACGPSVLRRPANQLGVSPTLVQHRKNSSRPRCPLPKLLTAISMSSAFHFFRQAVAVLQLSPSNSKARSSSSAPYSTAGAAIKSRCTSLSMHA